MTDRPSGAPGLAAPGLDDCWNRIGVLGDGSCPELQQHVHCHNCPVYSRAALALLDREAPRTYIAEWTSHFATPKHVAERDTQSVVIFRVGAEWLALTTPVVKEVADVRPIHSLPHRRAGVVLGLTNVRGELLVCVSLAGILGLAPADQPSRENKGTVHERLLVIRGGTMLAVCPADEVYGIHHVDARELEAVPATVARAATTYSKAVVSWRGHSVGVLDDQRLFQTLQRSLA